MSVYGVGEYLDRAKAFIELGDENSLRHACLELRLCLESIVYQKLGQIGDQLPPSVYETWQPSKALKLLLSFEPRADQEAAIKICLNNENGEPDGNWLDLGAYKMFSAKWLYKHYSKLGNFLHQPSLAQSDDPPELNALMIEDIVKEVERVASANLIMTMNSISTAQCTLCGADVYVSKAQIEDEAIVECYREVCRAKHQVTRLDDSRFTIGRVGFYFWTCKGCGQRMPMDTIKHGDVRACMVCNLDHIFVWNYGARVGPVNSAEASSSTGEVSQDNPA